MKFKEVKNNKLTKVRVQNLMGEKLRPNDWLLGGKLSIL